MTNENFSWTTVAEIAHEAPRAISIGPFGSDLRADLYTSSGVPVVRGQDITDTKLLNESDMPRVAQETAQRLYHCLVQHNDLIFPHRGAIGRVGIVTESEYLLSSSMMRLRCDETRVDPLFIFYYFRGPGREELLSRASTVGTPGIGQPLRSLRGIPLLLPRLGQQRAIAGVLGALDNKIATNISLVSTARELASIQFKAILPDKLTESTVGSIMSLEYGRALPATSRINGPVEVFGSGGIVGSHDSTWLKGPGVVVGRKGTAGSVHWARADFYPIDTTFYVLPRRKSTSLIFCFHALRELDLRGANSDSAVPGLNRSEAYGLPIKVPNDYSMTAASDRAISLFRLADTFEEESRVLANLRDTLLPQLMSGKLRVRDAEKQVEEVV